MRSGGDIAAGGSPSTAGAPRGWLVCALTLVLGAVLLRLTLAIPQGSFWFYLATAGLATVWCGGARLVQPVSWLPSRPWTTSRLIGVPLLVGLGLAAIFVLGALVARTVPALADQTRQVTGFADAGDLVWVALLTAATGVAEELFFRGALYDACPPRRRVALTTVAYAAVTLATGNVMLAFAAAVLGLVTGWHRHEVGGVLGPVLIHLTWSLSMLFVLPVVL